MVLGDGNICIPRIRYQSNLVKEKLQGQCKQAVSVDDVEDKACRSSGEGRILKDMRIKQIPEQWITGTLVAKKIGNSAFLFYHVSPRIEYWFNEMSDGLSE